VSKAFPEFFSKRILPELLKRLETERDKEIQQAVSRAIAFIELDLLSAGRNKQARQEGRTKQ
jgi:hypothetical protein